MHFNIVMNYMGFYSLFQLPIVCVDAKLNCSVGNIDGCKILRSHIGCVRIGASLVAGTSTGEER